MKSFAALLLCAMTAAPIVAAEPNPDEAILYCFTAQWCTYCHEMQPVLNRMHQDGYTLRMVDKDKYPEFAQQMGVRGLPYFVLTRGDQPVAQAEGRTSYERLAQMFRESETPVSRGQSRNLTTPNLTTQTAQMPGSHISGAQTQPNPAMVDPAANPPSQFAQPRTGGVQPASHTSPAPSMAPSADSAQGQDIRRQAMEASVRLKVEDPDGNSFGSGTIVHRQGEDALVLTCAHIFRDSQGQGKINVDIFPPSGQQTVIGQIITYDLERDVALVAIRTAAKVAVMPLGSRGTECQVGQTVFSIGCDQGGDRLLHNSRVNTVNRYQGPANVQVAGTPIDGRSGGGLFAADGQVIGVCNAADPADDEGLYAAIPTIYEVLDQAKLAELFQNQTRSPAPTNLAQEDNPAPRSLPAGNPTQSQPELANHPRSTPLNVASADPGRSPLAMTSNPASAPATSAASTGGRSLSQVEQEILDYLQAQNGSAEVTVVLRNRDNPSAQPAVFSLPGQPSPEFLQQISGQPQPASQAASPRQAQAQDGVILRGQNR